MVLGGVPDGFRGPGSASGGVPGAFRGEAMLRHCHLPARRRSDFKLTTTREADPFKKAAQSDLPCVGEGCSSPGTLVAQVAQLSILSH